MILHNFVSNLCKMYFWQLGRFNSWVTYAASCLNIHEDLRFTNEATILVGYFPSIKEGHNMGNNKAKISARRRELFHQCLDKLFEPFVEYMQRGLKLRCFDGEIHVVKPFLSAYLADMIEHHAICLNIEGSCNYCETTRVDLANENVSKHIRTNEDARDKFEGTQLSI